MLADLFEPTLIKPDADDERTCGTCLERKTVDNFYKDGKDQDGNNKYRRDCKDCYRKTRLQSRKAKANKAAPRSKQRSRRK